MFNSTFKRILSLFFVMMLAWFQVITPASASPYSINLSKGYLPTLLASDNFAENCFFGRTENAGEEIACDIGKGVVVTGGVAAITVGACYAADMLAATMFPPALALAPLCSAAGVPALAAGAGMAAATSK